MKIDFKNYENIDSYIDYLYEKFLEEKEIEKEIEILNRLKIKNMNREKET